jgi:dynein heavy chain 1
MNPANEDFSNRSATSPALFNRCVVDWFGEWSPSALKQVGDELLGDIDLSYSSSSSSNVSTTH